MPRSITPAHPLAPVLQLSVDVPWSPDCIDGRCYDFVGLQRHADMFFVMGYDLRSQVHGNDCVAGYVLIRHGEVMVA